MEQYVGLDVSQEQTSVCVVDGGGKVIWEGKCTSTPEAIAATIRTRAPEAVRIGLESGPFVGLALARAAEARPAGGLSRRSARQGGARPAAEQVRPQRCSAAWRRSYARAGTARW